VDAQDLGALGGVGKSTKNSSSKRPRRKSSGGRPWTSLAVATTNTGSRFSDSQVRNQPNTRDATGSRERGGETLLDLVDPHHGGRERSRDEGRLAQRDLGAALAAERRARSRRRSGNCHSRATARAESDLPQPCTPSRSRPRGVGRQTPSPRP